MLSVSQIFIVSKADLRRRIGALDHGRVQEVLDGINLLPEPREVRR
jgi:hypothetical protein